MDENKKCICMYILRFHIGAKFHKTVQTKPCTPALLHLFPHEQDALFS